MAYDAVIEQLRGPSKIDFRGMTPEQIAAISGQGQQATAQAIGMFGNLRGQDMQQEQFDRTEARQERQFAEQQKTAQAKMAYDMAKDQIEQEWKQREFELKSEMHQVEVAHKSALTDASRQGLAEARFKHGIWQALGETMVPTDIGDLSVAGLMAANEKGAGITPLTRNLMTQVVEANGRQMLIQMDAAGNMHETDLGAARQQGTWFSHPETGEGRWVPDGENPPPGYIYTPKMNIEAGPEHVGISTFEKKLAEVRARTSDPKFTDDVLTQFKTSKPGMIHAAANPKSSEFVTANRELASHFEGTLQTIWRDFGTIAFYIDGPQGTGFYLEPKDGSTPYIVHKNVLSSEFVNTLR